MNKKIVAIVPAAGLGKRFGEGHNKTFLTLRDKPVVLWSLEALESVNEIAEVIPVFKKDDMGYARNLIERHNLSKVKLIAPGGKERQDSVYQGLKLIEDAAAVLIHDGVRPLIEKDLIKNALQELMSAFGLRGDNKRVDGVIVGVPLKDTVKEVKSGIVKKTLKRNLLWAIQTPQIFKYASLVQAYKKAMREGFYSTDDSAIVERYGGKVKIIMGSYENIKITTPEDIEAAELFLRKRVT